jgi:hypothetical protein
LLFAGDWAPFARVGCMAAGYDRELPQRPPRLMQKRSRQAGLWTLEKPGNPMTTAFKELLLS